MDCTSERERKGGGRGGGTEDMRAFPSVEPWSWLIGSPLIKRSTGDGVNERVMVEQQVRRSRENYGSAHACLYRMEEGCSFVTFSLDFMEGGPLWRIIGLLIESVQLVPFYLPTPDRTCVA